MNLYWTLNATAKRRCHGKEKVPATFAITTFAITCPLCGYSLTGNVGGACPEFGGKMEPLAKQ
jgi:ribosomal protein S27E